MPRLVCGQPALMRCQKAAGRGRQQVAASVASERQLTGIINLADGFQAANSRDRLSSLDPLLPLRLRFRCC